MALIISDKDGNEIINQTEYENEAEMQEYIENNPEAIPLYQIDEELEISIAAREFNVDGEFIDAVAFDQNGGIYILETKLETNSDKRQVIAQAFDYGAALWDNQTPNQFVNNLEAVIEHDTFKDWVEEELDLDEEGYEEFRENMFENLQDGNFSYVIVMDRFTERLKALIKYLMANSMFDLYGVELEYHQYEDKTIVVPNLYGTEVKKNAQSTRRSTRNTYTERGKLFDKLQKKFSHLAGSNVDFTNGNRYRQIRFEDVPSYIHLEWIFSGKDEDQTLNIRLDFEKTKDFDFNEKMLEHFQKNKFKEIKKVLGIDEIKTSKGRTHTKFYISKNISVDEAIDEKIQQEIVENTYNLYELVKDDVKEKSGELLKTD